MKYRKTNGHIFPDEIKNKFTDSLEWCITEQNSDGSFNRFFCYCTSEEDAQKIINALNICDERDIC